MNERDIFIAALQKEAQADRRAYLEEACKGDHNLRRGVEALLEMHDRAGSFLESPAADLVSAADDPPTAHPGTVIGPYRLLEQLGEGGFGVVFLAEQQQPVHRQVALKILKPGMDTRQVVARFEAERQALALMDHTNIARVLDAGASDTGRPYFVMELVRGIPITAFCDQNHLPVRERLGLFLAVCQAVEHAHQKGIIHRDLKPSNVLVTRHDCTPLVKVIDFGIAKALGQERLTEKTLCTGFAHMIGTPLYMSPEQAEMSGQDADTRTDIYSLGVLLYELLTGTTPLDKDRLKEANYDEIRRILREEEPAKPSARISTLGQAATTVAANRKSEPRRLCQLFRGELDWIVMKALEKDRNRRYESASSFAADVQRYLHDEPVQACPPSALYRFSKFARRNKVVLAMAAVVACAVLLAVAGLAASTVFTLQAKDELQQTLQREQQNSYFQRIALAEREWSAYDVRAWEQLLATCPSELRGWEWRYLRRLGHKALPLMRHAGAVLGGAISHDGRQFASCSQDGSVKIWDAKTGHELRTIPRAHEKHVRSIAFSPDGQWLASVSWDGTVKVWDAHTDREPYILKGHQGEVWSVAFSPDGKWLASAGGKSGELGEVILWNAATRRRARTLRGHTSSVYVAFSPDSKRLASAGAGDNTIKLWDVETGQEQPGFSKQDYHVYGVAFSPDGRLLASCGGPHPSRGDGRVKVWSLETGKELFDLHGHTRAVWSVAFSPDGRRLASGSVDKTVKLWDVASGQAALTLRGHQDEVRRAVFSPDGDQLFSCSDDWTIRVWDATPVGPEEDDGCRTLRGHRGDVTCVAFSPKEPAVVGSTSADGTIKLWNTLTGEILRDMGTRHGIVESLAFSPDARLLATVGQETNVKIWDTETGRWVHTLSLKTDDELSVAFLPGGRQLVSAGYDKAVRIWDLETRQPIHTLLGHSWKICGVACSPNGRLVASASIEGTVRLWDLETGKELADARLQIGAKVRSVAFSSDGRQLAAGCGDWSVKIWDTSTWKLLHSLHNASGEPRSVAFSPDGRRVAWGGTDSTVRVWEAATGEIEVLRGHTNWVHSVAFSTDGKQIASASADGTVKIWNTLALPMSRGRAKN